MEVWERRCCYDERIDCGWGRAASVTQGSLGGRRIQQEVVKCNGLEVMGEGEVSYRRREVRQR